jgi:transcriptional regulator with XRE-family HTH domain
MGVQHQTFGFSIPSRALRSRTAPEKVEPNPIDVHVGHKLRLRRTLLGMSQEKLGEAIGLTFQQVQKYERGANRIGASRLWDMSRILNCPISYFFEDISAQVAAADGSVQEVRNNEDDPLIQRETLELVRAYYNINDYHVRRRIYDLARSLAQMDETAKLAGEVTEVEHVS